MEEQIEIGSSDTARRFIFVHDLVDGIVKLIEHEDNPHYQVLNLAGTELLSLGDVIKTAEQLTGKKADVKSKKQTPSIRNPISNKAEDLLGQFNSTSIEKGLSLSLQRMMVDF
jgi:nucleoside-diphosphate-sugar epimerase